MTEDNGDAARKDLARLMAEEHAIRRQMYANTVERHKLEDMLAKNRARRNEAILATRNTLPLGEVAERLQINRETARTILHRELEKRGMGLKL